MKMKPLTPKEKAQELVNKFSAVGLQVREEGIHCALIAVDEILNVGFMDTNDLYEYWQEVKQEIENL